MVKNDTLWCCIVNLYIYVVLCMCGASCCSQWLMAAIANLNGSRCYICPLNTKLILTMAAIRIFAMMILNLIVSSTFLRNSLFHCQEASFEKSVSLFGHCPFVWLGGVGEDSLRENWVKIFTNAYLNLDNSSLNKCPKPSWQGSRPSPPNGQCPNRSGIFFGGASLSQPACD